MMGPVQMAYDRAITVFSPDGRLFQVEYAREAVKRGTTAVGIKAKDGVVLLVDKRITSRLLEPPSVEKIFQIDDHIGAAASGLVADARILIDRGRVEAQINRVVYNESIGVETLAKKICDHMQSYTQFGGVRPYGTAMLIAGINGDSISLFETDPSGTLLEYKATGIGDGRNTAIEVFEEQYKDDLDLDEAILLGLEALYKATEGKIDAQTVEVGIIESEIRLFKKLAPEEVKVYVQQILDRHVSKK
ncbi:MAG: archaeal proteasome endopeptidase complex subunit alpha [Methanocellales archaeon]|nr:archaeal proteasome endopeptidase complex subunit alpha [Methanocellales archaeon]MDD3291611.1 archaeal proteasome endopeptidase complex subunit alpha [Methanocellales archaeon]MDD5235180.1 archaeal proteasome endopeptidase complex subunit alpha [Methanocellales archaeon]MDD5485394.1 archaeal proteasome endopeptidase complex subunit alpha [Methanocellales archaeon]